MKLLKVIIILSSIFVFSANARGGELSETKGSFESMPNPIFLGEDIKYGMTAFVWRYTQFMRFRLSVGSMASASAASFITSEYSRLPFTNIEFSSVTNRSDSTSVFSDAMVGQGKIAFIPSGIKWV